ncbi:MAG: heme lyase CcmF/NrfE family subunit [Acidimicrobiia bacterium]
MIALVGYTAILVALAAALGMAVQGARSFLQAESDPRRMLRWPVWGLLAGAALAMGALEVALLTDDFSIEYVARNHSRDTPLIFTIASAWAALEGSIVLWGLVLAGFAIAVFWSIGDRDRMGAAALAVIGIVALFFFGLMASAANPFATLDFVPLDGNGANPLLQNHILMAIHPPMLYLGYIGMTVPFAFAIAALATGDGSAAWLERTRRWSLLAWTFLTLGIVLGGWWSYEVLGWGGYWAWDPVENASLLPWLTATAFVHSSIVQRRRGMLQAWNIALVIATFALTILGTFLTRSGVVASVHSFTQSAVGPALLGFLVVVLVGSFGLFALRAHLVSSPPRLDSLASREGVFLLNNLLLAVFAFVVLTGTIYPMILEAFSGDRVSVGAPWFDRAAIPLSLTLLLAMGLGPLTPYRFAAPDLMWRRLRGPLQAASIVAAATVLLGVRPITVVITIWLATFVISGITGLAHRRARSGEGGYLAGLGGIFRKNPGFWGGMVAHVGVSLMAVAIAFSGSFNVRQTITLDPGESAPFDGYTLTYEGPTLRQEPNRRVIGAEFTLWRGTSRLGTLEPRLNQYSNQVQAIPTPSVRWGLREDVYLSLVRIEPGTARVTIDAFRFPLMWLLWAGALILVGGGAWSFVGGRRRRALDRPMVTARV